MKRTDYMAKDKKRIRNEAKPLQKHEMPRIDRPEYSKPEPRLVLNKVDKITLGNELIELDKYREKAPVYSGGRKNIALKFQETGEDKVIAHRIFLLASKGYKRDEIRYALNMTTQDWHKLLNKYSSQYPIYKVALDRGEMYATEEVEYSVKNRAMGYNYEEITHDEKNGTKIVKKHMPADTKAAMFYLTNKKPEEWKLKRDNEQPQVSNQTTINYNNLSLAALKELKELGIIDKQSVVETQKIEEKTDE